jgi:predicted lipid-binding transport protein (Tim44 family)
MADMKRGLVLAAIASLMLTWLVSVVEVAARSGGGGFRSGQRATREDERAARSEPEVNATPDLPRYEEPPAPVPAPKKGKSWRSMARSLLRGGLIGGIFFGRGFGGVGLLEVVIFSGLIAGAFWALSRYQTEPGQYAHASGFTGGPRVLNPTGAARSVGAGRASPARAGADLGRSDPGIDVATTAAEVGDMFRRVQAAWTDRDISRVAELLTVQMRDQLDRECARLKASRRINRVERIALGQVRVTDAWQDGGWDRVRVLIVATLIDYTTDEVGLKVIEGNPFDPVPFREQWELERPSGSSPWRLSAIA